MILHETCGCGASFSVDGGDNPYIGPDEVLLGAASQWRAEHQHIAILFEPDDDDGDGGDDDGPDPDPAWMRDIEHIGTLP